MGSRWEKKRVLCLFVRRSGATQVAWRSQSHIETGMLLSLDLKRGVTIRDSGSHKWRSKSYI